VRQKGNNWMRFRSPPPTLTTRWVVFVAVTTLTLSLVLSGVAVDAQSTAVRNALERTEPLALREQERALRAWLARRGLALEQALTAPRDPAILTAGLAAVAARRPSTSLAILAPDGRTIAGRLEPAPQADALPGALPRLATPVLLPGPVGAAYATALPIGRTAFHLVRSVGPEVAFGASRRFARRLYLGSFALAGLFTLLAHCIARRSLARLRSLSAGARRISRGEVEFELGLSAAEHPRDEIGSLTRTFDGMLARLRENQRQIEHSNESLRERNLELQQANRVLEQLSITDGLTKLHNHRYFQELLANESRRSERTGAHMALMLIDLDDFKRLNDCFGHAAGDQVLAAIAGRLDESIRETDLLARYGGEEFVVLSTGTDLAGAGVLAEKIRLAVEQAEFRIDDWQRSLPVTVSIGVAEYAGCCKRLFREADAALYRAKAMGKNCVIQATDGDAAR